MGNRERRAGHRRGLAGAAAVVTVVVVGALMAPVVAGPSPASALPLHPSAGSPVTVVVHTAHPRSTINEDLIGVNHITAGSESSLAAIGTRWARTDVSFEITTGSGPAYDCATGSWDPSYLDGQVAADEAAGATPELIVDYTPPCLATDPPNGVNPNYTPPDIGPDQAKWQALVYQMAVHEITDEGVRVFEVWNEPNQGFFWTGGLSGYLTLYRDTAQALEDAAATTGVSIEVGGPALGQFNGLDLSWITALAAYAVANGLPLDFVSWHLYADGPDEGPTDGFPDGLCLTGPGTGDQPCWYNPGLDPDLYRRQAKQVRAALASYPTLHPLLWVDEWNINAGEDARTDGPYGAAFVAAVLQAAQRGGIDRMSFFDTSDDPDDATQNWGLLFSDLAPKPAYFAMQMWNQMAGQQLPVTYERRSLHKEGTIDAMASVEPDGTIHVLVDDFAPYDPAGNYGTADPTPYDRPVDVVVPLEGHGYQVTRTVIDADDDGSPVASTVDEGHELRIGFTLAGEGVTLLTLTPTGP